MATTHPLSFQPGAAASDDAEELARAEVYGLLAQLFYAPPPAALYEQLQVAVTEAPAPGAFLQSAWTDLVAASRRMTREQVEAEYDALFVGIGKPEVFLYGSYFIAGALNEKPLVALRHALRELGLERPDTVTETEDHIAALCEVMRCLIAADGAAPLNVQQRFFNVQLRPWVEALCDAIAQHPAADFYAAVARFSRDFFAVEGQGFDLLEG